MNYTLHIHLTIFHIYLPWPRHQTTPLSTQSYAANSFTRPFEVELYQFPFAILLTSIGQKMPAPTALLRAPEEVAQEETPMLDAPEDAGVLLDTTAELESNHLPAATITDSMEVDTDGRPQFAPVKDSAAIHKIETRKVPIPPHRMSPLKATWQKLYTPVVEHLKLQVCNTQRPNYDNPVLTNYSVKDQDEY